MINSKEHRQSSSSPFNCSLSSILESIDRMPGYCWPAKGNVYLTSSMHIYMCTHMHTITSNIWNREDREGAKQWKKRHWSWFGYTLAHFFSLLGMPNSSRHSTSSHLIYLLKQKPKQEPSPEKLQGSLPFNPFFHVLFTRTISFPVCITERMDWQIEYS